MSARSASAAGSPVPAEAPLDCALCPRLAAFRAANRAVHPDWHNAPVPSFGTDTAELLIVGLAPGMNGANRTGRPFTGDYAGDLLYATLNKFGLSSGTYRSDPGDGLKLKKTMISNAVRCLPPENKPTGAEIVACRPFLAARIAGLPRLKAILVLGRIAHDSTIRALGARLADYPFGHALRYVIDGPNGPLAFHDSYHCSRYNTNTGRLTEDMFENVFAAITADLSRRIA
ncbi:MAG: uracil-DNA glycosylase [Hyphomonadaceae bacterium]